MFRTLSAALVAALFLCLACGGEGEETSGAVTGDTVTMDENVTEDTSEVVEPAPPPLYPEGTLDPDLITPDTPVSAAALYQAYFAWDGMQVTLQGYPDIMYSDSMTVEDELRLVDVPGGDDELATFTFTEPQGIPVREDQLVTVRGTVDYYWTGELRLTDAFMVEGAPEVSPGVLTSPYVCDPETPVPVGDFHDVFSAWIGREVTVEGYYHSTTTSTTDYGVTVRIDLAEPGDIYTKYVACEMTGEIPEDSDSLLVEERDGVRIRGTVTGESFGMVGLENCVLVNR
jgi:hypothetical protein